MQNHAWSHNVENSDGNMYTALGVNVYENSDICGTLNNMVQLSGDIVNLSVVNEYTLVYEVDINNFTLSTSVIVNVVETLNAGNSGNSGNNGNNGNGGNSVEQPHYVNIIISGDGNTTNLKI